MYPNDQEKRILKVSILCGIFNLISNGLLVILKIFNPITAMITTTIAELLIIILHNKYIKSKLQIKLKIFSKQNLIYLGLSLLFIPIALLIKYIDFGFI